MVRSNFFVKLKKAQTTIEFSLVLVVAIMAFIGIQPMIKRAIQGDLRNSADRLGEQFSPRWTSSSRTNIVHSSTEENTTYGHLIRTTSRDILSLEDRQISSIKDESPELRD